VNISKDQIVQLLESQGNHDKAQQASQELPDQVDTGNGQHADLLSRSALTPAVSATSSAGSGKFSKPAGRGGLRGSWPGVGGVGRRRRAPVRCCPGGLSPAPHPLDPAKSGRVLGSAGLDRRGAVVFVHPAEARRTLRRSSVAAAGAVPVAIKWCRGSGTGPDWHGVWLLLKALSRRMRSRTVRTGAGDLPGDPVRCRGGVRIAWQGGCDAVRRRWCGSAGPSSFRNLARPSRSSWSVTSSKSTPMACS